MQSIKSNFKNLMKTNFIKRKYLGSIILSVQPYQSHSSILEVEFSLKNINSKKD